MPQTVVITGASAGIGRATARLYGERGANVVLIARGRAGLEAAAREVESLGGRPLVQVADTADAHQVETAAEAAEQSFGPIDVWINSAFTSVFAPFDEITAEEYDRVTQVAYLGFVNGTRSALKRMLPRDHGTIVQVGSALGERAIPLQSAYCGAKHAINGFTSSLRTELLHCGSDVHLTIAQMPAVNTPQFSWVRSRLPRHPQPVPPHLPAGGGSAGRGARRRPPATEAVLRWRPHGGDDLGQPPGPRPARPLPRPHRLRRPADRPAAAERREQPLRTGRLAERHRPRRPRRIR